MLEEDNVRKGFFEADDFQTFYRKTTEYLQAPVASPISLDWRLRSEILKLTWTNVDFKAGTIRLEPGRLRTKGAA